MEEDKINKLIEILNDLTFQQWQWLKRDIDAIYESVQIKNVPNGELETFKEKLQRCYMN